MIGEEGAIGLKWTYSKISNTKYGGDMNTIIQVVANKIN